MTLLDWGVMALYLIGIVAFAAVRSRSQNDVNDYYLAGRSTRWWQSGFSTMATQLGAISFVSAPAFVAMKSGGGLKWLCYEFGVPLGILIVIVVILPILHRGSYISIYEYLEDRFDTQTRVLVSMLFQLGRGLATAVSVLAGGLILSTALPITTVQAILIIGIVTILYDMLGGIKIVILSDVVQMSIIAVGILICGGVALSLVGWDFAWNAMGPDRLRVLDFSRWGFSAGGEYSFWPMTIGGIFLYASYYGCDQSQVQREMSVGSLKGVRKSLYINAFGRFPMVLMYCLMGVFVGAVFASPEHLGILASKLGMESTTITQTLQSDPDRMIPMFVLGFLPPGIVGIVFVAIMSALMSSLDSAINSLSAVTMQDFYKRYFRPEGSDRHYLIASKLWTVFWGVFCIVAAIAFAEVSESTRQTTIVLINAVGSLLYGPILAAFLTGMLSRRITAGQIKTGVILGIVVNLILWQATEISWLWWNAAGFIVTVAVAGIMSLTGAIPRLDQLKKGLFLRETSAGYNRRMTYGMIFTYFLIIIAVSYLIEAAL
jgi:sodium-dependent multivitamin transporter 6